MVKLVLCIEPILRERWPAYAPRDRLQTLASAFIKITDWRRNVHVVISDESRVFFYIILKKKKKHISSLWCKKQKPSTQRWTTVIIMITM